MINRVTEELRNFWGCLNNERSHFCVLAHFGGATNRALLRVDFCGAANKADFCEGGAQDFSCGGRTHGAILRADFSYGTAILTAPKPLLDKALSKGGGG